MARLVAVCREGEDDHHFLARQIPLYVDEVVMMVMEFSDSHVKVDHQESHTSQWKQFCEFHSQMNMQDLNLAMLVTSREVYSALSQLVPCVGCRRSVERLLSHLVQSGKPALDPLTVKPTGMLSVTNACLTDVKKLYSLLYIQGSKLNDMIDSIPKSKKNKRCQLHSLDTHKPKPFVGSWMDVWERMSQECRDEVVVIDSASLLETLETYLHKHRFCTDCKSKVLRAYNILVGEVESSEEKGYSTALFEGLCCCPHEHHIHVCCETDFIAHLLSRAEPEFAGGYERRERHAKTIPIAQEEVLTCLGIHLYERLHRIWQRLRAEEQTWQILFHLGIDALRKRFEIAVEKMQGISRLEQLVGELSEEERAKELKQERKRQKKKNRRKNKCGFDMVEREIEDKEKNCECCLESMEGGCNTCGSHDEGEGVGFEEGIATNESTTCSCEDVGKKDLSTHSNSSDYGYSSSMDSSEPGSREGSDVACSEGICNHDEAGDDPNLDTHHKEQLRAACLLDCWTPSEKSVHCQSKKTKPSLKSFSCEKGPRNGVGMPIKNQCRSATTLYCPTKEISSNSDGKLANRALRLPCTANSKKLTAHVRPPATNFSLVELLDGPEMSSDEENGLTQDEIHTFLENNKSFYNNRHLYRQHLKDKFTNYCRITEQNNCVCMKGSATRAHSLH